MGIDMYVPFSSNVHCDGVSIRRSLGVTTSNVDDEAGKARLTPVLHCLPLLPGGTTILQESSLGVTLMTGNIKDITTSCPAL